MSCVAFSESSAQNTQLLVLEAKEWIEAVTERKFKNNSIRESLEDGVLLCKLINKIYPGFVKRINNSKSPIAYLDNIQQFLLGCQNLGLKDAQLFDVMDLQNIKGVTKTGVKRNEVDRRIRAVCITLYWLGRRVAELDDYDGPQLDLDHFKILMEENIPDTDEDRVKETDVTLNGKETVHDYQLEKFQFQEEMQSPMATANSNGSMTASSIQENGLMLTFEQEQTADELLADIQNAVDEMLENFHLNPVPTTYPSTIPPQPINPDTERANSTDASSVKSSACHDEIDRDDGTISKFSHTIKMLSGRESGFGFQVMGGVDSIIPAQVDYIIPGSIAENAGLKVGDILLYVNSQMVSDLSHVDLVGVIKQAGRTGEVVIQVGRADENGSYQDGPRHDYTHQNNTSISDALNFSCTESYEKCLEENEEKIQHAQEISPMYPQRNARSLDNEINYGPPPSYGRKSLPILVEHHEEALFEEIQEMMESASHSLSLELAPSSFLPLQKSCSEPAPTEHSSLMPTSPLQDNMKSIEHELQELVLMETTEHQAQSYSLSDSTSEEEGQVSAKKIGIEKAADTAAIKFNSFEVEESNSPLPLSHIHEIPIDIEIRQIEANSPRETPTQSPTHTDDVPVSCPPEISLVEPVNKLTNLSEDNSLPVPPRTALPEMHSAEDLVITIDLPFSPKPKRVVRRPAPPPPSKSESKQTPSPTNTSNASTPVNDEIIAVANGNDNSLLQSLVNLEHVPNTQPCSLPQNVSSPQGHLLTSQTHASTTQQDTPTKHAPSSRDDVSSSRPKHTPSPQEDVSCPEHAPSPRDDVSSSRPKHTLSPQEDVSCPKHAPSPRDDVSSSRPKHTPSPQEDVSCPKHAPSLQLQEPVSNPVHGTSSPLQASSPLEASSLLQDLFMTTPFQRSNSPDLVTQMHELAYSKAIGFETSTSTQAKLCTNMEQKNGLPPGISLPKHDYKLQVTQHAKQQQQQQQPPIPSLASQNSDSINSSIMPSGPAAVVAPPIKMASTPDNVELMGNIKIQRVQKTRWTPAESSPSHTAVITETNHPASRSATLPSTHLHNEMSMRSNSTSCRDKKMHVEMNGTEMTKKRQSMGACVMVARGIGGGISGRTRKAPEQKKPPLRNNICQAHVLQKTYQQQPWRSQEDLKKQQKLYHSNKPQKYTITPDGTSTLRMQQSKILSKGPIKDHKENRSMTWSVGKDRVMDGFQVAYAMHAKSSSDLCSCCHQPLGQGVVLSLPMLRAQYHTKCFTCCVCRSPLGQETRNITVLMKDKQPYCRLCASSDNGMLTTEC